MILKLVDLSNGVIKLSMAGTSFLINTEKNIKKITKIDDITEDGILIIECTTKDYSEPIVQWINLKPFLETIHRSDILKLSTQINHFILA